MLLASLGAMALATIPIACGAPVHLVEEAPDQITNVAPGIVLVDFGRVAFGNLRLIPPVGATGKIIVHFGESFVNGRINRKPPGTVRYARVETTLSGSDSLVVAPAADKRNTKEPEAVLAPPDLGTLFPFRWVEIEGWPGQLKPEQIKRRAAFAADWDDDASAFRCSDDMLNRIWELCRYSVKATTFAGLYVDGDRERICYEADAYLAQINRYYADGDTQMARDTFDRLLKYPTWPTAWAPQMIFMAYADWMQTGDTNWLGPRYSALKEKLQFDITRDDGLMGSWSTMRNDVVDWPPGECKGFVFRAINTVMNAFHLRALAMMGELARALRKDADAADFSAREKAALASFQNKLFDAATGLYRDGEGTDHSSPHANFFPLALDLTPTEDRPCIAAWLAKQGMTCSVYGAQYFLQALFENGQADAALQLITAPNDRSWSHMVNCGATITWEAWDERYKPNLDWNHVWGAAPANLLPEYVLGVRTLAPGWTRALIRPNPGALKWAEGKVPTPLGPVVVHWDNGNNFKLSVALPAGMTAQVQLPASQQSKEIFLNGQPVPARRDGGWWILNEDVAGTTVIETR